MLYKLMVLVLQRGSLFICSLIFTLDLGTLDTDYELLLPRITIDFSYGSQVMYATSLLVDIILHYYFIVHAMSI